jgi:hypothetical protein
LKERNACPTKLALGMVDTGKYKFVSVILKDNRGVIGSTMGLLLPKVS